MKQQRKQNSDISGRISDLAYSTVLNEARQITETTLESLRALQRHFPDDLPEDDLAEVQWSAEHPDRERRQRARRHRLAATVTVRQLDLRQPRQTAKVCDCSTTGMGILLPTPVAAGSLLAIWFGSTSDRPVVAQVRNCHQIAGEWRIGCVFVYHAGDHRTN